MNFVFFANGHDISMVKIHENSYDVPSQKVNLPVGNFCFLQKNGMCVWQDIPFFNLRTNNEKDISIISDSTMQELRKA